MNDLMPITRCTEVLADDPIGDTVCQPFEAFNQGFDAFYHGLESSSNPYPARSQEFRWWENGWYEAKSLIRDAIQTIEEKP